MIEYSGIHVCAKYTDGRERNIFIVPSPADDDLNHVAGHVFATLMADDTADKLLRVTAKRMTALQPAAPETAVAELAPVLEAAV